MSKNNTKLVPALRFSAFKDTEGWREYSLNNVTPSIFDGTHQTPRYTDEGVPFYSVENIVSGNKNKFIFYQDYQIATKKNKPEKGDVLVTRIGKIGFSQVVTWEFEFSVYVTLAVIKQSKLFNSFYLHYFIQSSWYQREILSKSLLSAVPCKINMDSLRKTNVLLPRLDEQQKIADCLSSLDELIAEHARKLEALQSYKKGLMQNLFPAEGETTPKIRFPEFKNTDQWTKTKLIDTASKKIKWSFIGGPFGSNLKSSDYTNTGIRIIQLQNIGDGVFIDNYKIYTSEDKANELLSCNIYPGDIILSKMGDPVARACLIPDIEQRYVMCSDGIRLVIDENKYDKYFIYSTINSESFRKKAENSSTGSTRKRIGLDVLKKLTIMLPSIKEQHKISKTLFTVDKFISNQINIIESLKDHKKGLMQQLFPSMELLEG